MVSSMPFRNRGEAVEFARSHGLSARDVRSCPGGYVVERPQIKVGDRVIVEAASRLDGPGIVLGVYDDDHYEVEPIDPDVRRETTRLRVARVYVKPAPRGKRRRRR